MAMAFQLRLIIIVAETLHSFSYRTADHHDTNPPCMLHRKHCPEQPAHCKTLEPYNSLDLYLCSDIPVQATDLGSSRTQ
jgi:hypothetical protein